MLQFTDTYLKEVLLAVTDTLGLLDGDVIGLFSNEVEPDDPTLAWADFTVSAFSGYAASTAIVWGSPYYDMDDGEWKIAGGTKEFRSVTATPYVSGSARGFLVYKPGGTPILHAYEVFDSLAIFDIPDRVRIVLPEIPGSAVFVG